MTFIKKYPEYLLFIFFAVIGVFTANSYGFAWDEYEQRNIGVICYNYIFNNDQYYLEYGARDHGAVFEMFLYIIEKITGLTNNRDIYYCRHLVSHLVFLISAVCLYKLILLMYQNKKLAILGFLMLVLHPTIYGHSFFNSKDVPFLSLFIICFYQFALAFRDKKHIQFIWLALFTSFVINIRLMGILFVGFVIFFLVLDFIIYRKEKKIIRKQVVQTLLYLFFTILFTIATWPLLWHNLIENFKYTFNNLSQYPWGGSNLFKGEIIDATKIGWDYIPTWFCINTPIIFLILGFSGILFFTIRLLKNLKNIDLKSIDKNNLLFLFSFVAPILSVIVLKSVLYDTWRHLFYIYPSFILLGIYFLNYCVNSKFKKVALSVTTASIISISVYIISNFPFHHVYFNQFISHKNDFIRKNYEMDYWGVSYNKALEALLELDSSDVIKISSDNPVIIANSEMLADDEQKRIQFADSIHKSDYFVVTYRWHPKDYDTLGIKEVKSYSVMNSKIYGIYKVKK
mgnify:FL=1